MCFFLSHPELREQIDKLARLYLQLPRQLVDSDLTHKYRYSDRRPFAILRRHTKRYSRYFGRAVTEDTSEAALFRVLYRIRFAALGTVFRLNRRHFRLRCFSGRLLLGRRRVRHGGGRRLFARRLNRGSARTFHI